MTGCEFGRFRCSVRNITDDNFLSDVEPSVSSSSAYFLPLHRSPRGISMRLWFLLRLPTALYSAEFETVRLYFDRFTYFSVLTLSCAMSTTQFACGNNSNGRWHSSITRSWSSRLASIRATEPIRKHSGWYRDCVLTMLLL